jgi:hypothetical protein
VRRTLRTDRFGEGHDGEDISDIDVQREGDCPGPGGASNAAQLGDIDARHDRYIADHQLRVPDVAVRWSLSTAVFRAEHVDTKGDRGIRVRREHARADTRLVVRSPGFGLIGVCASCSSTSTVRRGGDPARARAVALPLCLP